MFTFTVTNSNKQSLQLTQNKNYKLINITGLTPPIATINSAQVAGGDGAEFNSAKVGTRNIVLTVILEAPIERNRINLYKFFHIKQLIKLAYSNGSRDIEIEGYVESVEGSLFSMRESIQISIICLQPYFKDATGMVHELSRILKNFEFPFAIEEEGIEFSMLDPIYSVNVENKGDAPNGMIIELTAMGEVINPIIYNLETRASFGLEFTMKSSDVIVINTNRGEKAVTLIRAGIKTNLINAVKRDSTWFNIEIGENVFTYSADAGAELLEILFKHTDLYEGV